MIMGHSHALNNTIKTLSDIQIKCAHLFDRRWMLPMHCNGKPSIRTIEFYAMRWSTRWSQSSQQIKILILFTRGQLWCQPAVKYTSLQASRNASYQLKSPPPSWINAEMTLHASVNRWITRGTKCRRWANKTSANGEEYKTKKQKLTNKKGEVHLVWP